MSNIRSVAIGCGSYLPQRQVSNHELETMMDTTDEWIVARSGISFRHIAEEGEKSSDLGAKAAMKALENAGLIASDIDAIIVATATADSTFPSTATIIQKKLGLKSGFAYDVSAACAGFIFALSAADGLIRSEQAKRVLVIGAETFSRIIDWTDRSTAVLFGDGAGAVILEGQKDTDRGILASDLHSDGDFYDILYVDGGASSSENVGKLRMKGKEVFRHAVTKLAQTAETSLNKAGLSHDDVDWIVPHQANIRIIQATAEKLKIPMEQVIQTVQNHGNTSAASIPLALDYGVQSGKIQKGQVLALEAIGGGLAWGSCILRW